MVRSFRWNVVVLLHLIDDQHYNLSVKISILKGISPNFQNTTRLYSKGKTMFSMIQNETSTGSCSRKEDNHFL